MICDYIIPEIIRLFLLCCRYSQCPLGNSFGIFSENCKYVVYSLISTNYLITCRDAAIVMLSGQIADAFATVFAGELVQMLLLGDPLINKLKHGGFDPLIKTLIYLQMQPWLDPPIFSGQVFYSFFCCMNLFIILSTIISSDTYQ